MSTNLRILLDESVTDPLATLLKEMPSLNIECCRELGIKGASDEAVIAYAKETRRITVTTESGMNDKSFPICTHPGIIVLTGRKRHESIHAENFKKFLLSGHRIESKDAVSFVSEEGARIKTHADTKFIDFKK